MNTGSATSSFKMKKVYNLRKTLPSISPKIKPAAEQDLSNPNNNTDRSTNSNKNNNQANTFNHQQANQQNNINGDIKNEDSSNNNRSFSKRPVIKSSHGSGASNNGIISNRQTDASQTQPQQQQHYKPIISGPQLTIDTLFLQFDEKLNCTQSQEVKVKNIGSSAVYYEWAFKNNPKVNPNAIKDVKPKFFCHYGKQSIKPGQQITFVFSFMSEVPGLFMEQCTLYCEPEIKTPIPVIRLQGKAYIDDEWKQDRAQFLKELEQSATQCSCTELVEDIFDGVKLPQPQKPDVSDQKVAEELFEKLNQNLHLYFNPIVHKWFCELFDEVWKKTKLASQQGAEPYWDQSISTLRSLIFQSETDQVEKVCLLQRLEHYTHLSTFPMSQKSQIYDLVKGYLTEASFRLGGDLADQTKKELDMWEVPFREPSQGDTEEDLKQRKDEIDKIKAEWQKRTKRKKWTQQEDRQMLENFRTKLKQKVCEDILQKLSGFEQTAQYVKIEKKIQKGNAVFDSSKYFQFLERCKTVKEYPIEGKKVLIKFNLKLKENSQEKLQQLEEYLIKKQEEKRRIQEEKKNQDLKKKKVPAKKKGQKQEQQQKPITFDFATLLDAQNWNGFLQTLRTIQQKSPFLILIGCTYRDKIGRYDSKLSIRFLLEVLKSVDPSIQFMDHQQLFNIRDQLENETISEGSIYLLENLNFLPSQTLVAQDIQTYVEEVSEGQQQQRQKIVKRNVIYPQVRKNLDLWASELDLIVDEDRYLTQKSSGISSYSHKEVVLGTQWWRYVGMMCRVVGNCVILSGDFNPESYLLLSRLFQYCKKVYLGGALAVKFSIVQTRQKSKKLANISVSEKEFFLIQKTLEQNEQKLWIPKQFKLLKTLSVVQQGSSQQQIAQGQGQKQQPNQSQQSNGNNESEKKIPIQKYQFIMHTLSGCKSPSSALDQVIEPVQQSNQNQENQKSANVVSDPQQKSQQKQPGNGDNAAQVQVDFSNCQVVDISANQIADEFSNQVSTGHVFMIGRTTVKDLHNDSTANQLGTDSVTSLLRSIYKKQEQKRLRHSTQMNTPAGINYELDLVFYLIGIGQEQVEKIDFKERKKKKIEVQRQHQQDGQEENIEEQSEQEEDEDQDQGQDKKKIDSVADYKLASEWTVRKILTGEFDQGLKNIRKYPKPIVV